MHTVLIELRKLESHNRPVVGVHDRTSRERNRSSAKKSREGCKEE